jgi:site-specific recombinase XerD
VDLRDRALILFAVDSGARVGEMASMRLRDLDLHARTAIVLAKGGHTRPVVYGTAVASALDRYLRARARQAAAPAPYVWLGLQGRFTPSGMGQMLTARSQRAGLDRHVHPHAFRHFFLSEFLRAGGNETDVVRMPAGGPARWWTATRR